MRKREQFKPTAKTIVTQVRQTVVDAVRRVSAGQQSVATEVLGAPLQQLDFVIGPDAPYTLRNVNQYISISTPFPIGVELVAFGELPEPEVKVEERQFTTATLEVEPIVIGQFINIAVFDADLFGTTATVEVFNKNSGETEYATLHCVKKNEYRGFVQSLNSGDAGINFDGTMYCKDQDVLRFSYTDPNNERGLSQEITKDVVAVSPLKATTIMVQRFAVSGEKVRIAVYNGSTAPFQNFRVENTTAGISMDGMLEPAPLQPDVLIGAITLGPDNTGDELGVSANDVLVITYENGHDSTGIPQIITETATVKDPSTVTGRIIAAPTAKIYSDLEVTVEDFDLFTTEVEIYVTNLRTNESVPVALLEVWPGMSIFRGNVPITPTFGLPGDTLEITYSDYGSNTNVLTAKTVVASHVEHVEPVVEETPDPVDISISKPVQLTVNGLFVLNGSFAGTLKLYALDENEVRCTIIKA